MIRIGRKVTDREDIAKEAGKSVGTLRNKGIFKQLDLVHGGGHGTKELYDLQQAEVLAANLRKKRGESHDPIPALPDYDDFTEHELRGLVIAYLASEKEDGFEPDLTVDEADEMTEEELRVYIDSRDLLSLEEARLSIPENRRPTASTMASYYAGHKATKLPDPNRTFYGVDFWFRATMERWNEQERRAAHGIKGHGRPAGAKGGWTPRSEAALAIVEAAAERRAQAQQLLQENPRMTLTEIANTIGVSERTARRYIEPQAGPGHNSAEEAERRLELARKVWEKNPEITGSQLAEKLGVGPTAANRYLGLLGRPDSTNTAIAESRRGRAADLLQENPDISDTDLADELGVTPATAAEYRKDLLGQADEPNPRDVAADRRRRTAQLLKKNPDVTAAELAALFDVSTVTASGYIRKAKEGL